METTSCGLDADWSFFQKLQSNLHNIAHFLYLQSTTTLVEIIVQPSFGEIFAKCKCLVVEFEHDAKYGSRWTLWRPTGRKRKLILSFEWGCAMVENSAAADTIVLPAQRT